MNVHVFEGLRLSKFQWERLERLRRRGNGSSMDRSTRVATKKVAIHGEKILPDNTYEDRIKMISPWYAFKSLHDIIEICEIRIFMIIENTMDA